MYEVKRFPHQDRVLFSIENGDKLDYEVIEEAIRSSIQPDCIKNHEITSWTEGFTFNKDGLDVLFYELYCEDPTQITFELFPMGAHKEQDIEKLYAWVILLAEHIAKLEKQA